MTLRQPLGETSRQATGILIKRRGATALTYGLVVGLVAVAGIAAVTRVGDSVDLLFGSVSSTLDDTTSPTVTGTSTAQTPETLPENCQEVRDAGVTSDGTHRIDPDGAGTGVEPFDAYCAMRGTEGWTLIIRNVASENGTDSWNLYWDDYKNGFGGVASGTRSTGWIGNDRLHALTSDGVRLEVRETSGSSIWPYVNFAVADESNNYRLSVSNTAGSDNGFGNNHSGMQFTTRDRDNDIYDSGRNCATNTYNSGWWYYNCWSMVAHHEPQRRGYWGSAYRDLEWYISP